MIASLPSDPVSVGLPRSPVRATPGRTLPAAGSNPPAAPAQPRRNLQFQHDADVGRTIIRVVNPETGEVLRQIPTDVQLHLARWIAFQRPSIIDERA